MRPTSTPRCVPGWPATPADLRLLAERGRVILLDTEARRVPLDRRTADRDQPLPRRAQSGAPTLYLDPLCRCHPRPPRCNPCTFCVNQCTSGSAGSAGGALGVRGDQAGLLKDAPRDLDDRFRIEEQKSAVTTATARRDPTRTRSSSH